MSGKRRYVISNRLYDAVIFDLDGVVTKTAAVHAMAWKRLFDEYLEQLAGREGKPFRPFDADADYRRYLDGKPRYDGVRSFLESRGIPLPYGDPDDPPERETVCGLGNKKNAYLLEQLETQGCEAYPSTLSLIRQLKSQGFKVGLISSSRNCSAVLQAAGIAGLFDVKIDGLDSARLGLSGKPAPDIFLEAAKRLGVQPERSVVVEDAIAGVQAGRRGNFGLVLGVDRTGHPNALKEGGADIVFADLAELVLQEETRPVAVPEGELPSALARSEEIVGLAEGKRIAVFLDYDGTLTPIVDRPDLAVLDPDMRAIVKALAEHCVLAVISGRDLDNVRSFVQIETLYYAGSHGFDIAGPHGWGRTYQKGNEFRPVIKRAAAALRERLKDIPGALVEEKTFTVAAHYRLVAEGDLQEVKTAVGEVLARHPELRKTHGKKVFELQPMIEWEKGKAVLWLMEALELGAEDVLPIYIGDDVTDEDAFKALRGQGVGIIVSGKPGPTAARYVLKGTIEVKRFLKNLTAQLKDTSP